MDIDTVHEFVSDIGAEAERLSGPRKTMTLTGWTQGGDLEGLRGCPFRITGTVRMLNPLAESRGISWNQNSTAAVRFSTEDDIYQIVFNLETLSNTTAGRAS